MLDDVADDVYACPSCARMRPHTIRRLTLPGAPRLCDECFARSTPSENEGSKKA